MGIEMLIPVGVCVHVCMGIGVLIDVHWIVMMGPVLVRPIIVNVTVSLSTIVNMEILV